MKTVKAWHWVKDDWTLRDGQKVKVGKTYVVYGKLTMCERGLHASKKVLDALKYAPGNICCRVVCWQIEQEEDYKFVCHKRRVEWAYDATNILHEFACQVTEQALKKAKVKDKRCWAAIVAKRKWLKGEINDSELAASGVAAWGVPWAAARAATWAAAGDAARAATWAAAWGAARAAAWDEFNQLLENMIKEVNENGKD